MKTFLKIAGITISIEYPFACKPWNSKNGTLERYKPFFVNPVINPGININISKINKPLLPQGKMIFDSKGLWKLYASSSSLEICLSDPLSKKAHDEIIKTKGDFSSWEAGFSPSLSRKGRNALDYPVLEVIMMNILSKNLGILTHASGVISLGQGLLFCGNSGAGKSTLSQLWKKARPQDLLLTDDRAAITKAGKNFMIFGTPWSGSANVYSSESGILKKVFFIAHSEKNSINKIDGIEAASAIIRHSSLAYWNKAGLDFAIQFCAQLCKTIKCYRLGFVPDKSAVDFVSKFLNENER